ncbi:MAG: Gldg family protein [Alphaproteobacteria bacterium]|nr:Gldg family protein [Alphaproteobacteria bacterium]
MTAALVVARKELRALFQSPVALIFLGVFQLVTLFVFFSGSRFFARNIADVRPLFSWLPLLLVFLTAAVTMRAWAEERKLGTLEVLLTLPVRTADLVVGKFLASTALVGVALALTLPLPIMVSTLGPLDLGPVVGGYVGALLLGALYVSIGLCVSSRTDNQVVSLMLTLVLGGTLYLVGATPVTDLVAVDTGELLRAIGTGSRFESIERGVLDLRDLVYYGALTAFFLVLNHAFLETGRIDEGSARGRARSTAIWTVTLLAGANAIAAVVWLQPVTAARIDLTEGGEYSVSATTRRILAELEEPLFIDGYFSERTHPKLAPLVPQIRDTLAEYAIAGAGKVEVGFADPSVDEELEQEIAEQYSIRSVPFQVDDRHQMAVVNSFFHVLVRYGDQYEVLSFDDLIEVSATADGFEVKIKNLEYDLTRTIKRVSQDFQTLASVAAQLPEQATLTLYASPGSLPASMAEIVPTIRTVGEQVSTKAGDRLAFREVDPSTDTALQEQLLADYGIRPMRELFGTDVFYLELVLTMGDRIERLQPRGAVTEADLEQAIEAAVKRIVPGQLTTVGIYTEIPEAPPPNPQIPPQFQPPPPRPDYQVLTEVLGANYQVETVALDGEEPSIPPTIDLLVVGKAGNLTDKQLYAIDQYLMKGGRVVAMVGAKKIGVERGALAASPLATSLDQLLAAYGVQVSHDFVLDEQNAPFPRPVQERRGGMTLQRIEMTPYPFFPDVRQDGLDREHPAMAGLVNLTAPWAAALTVSPPEGVESTVLAQTTDQAWTYGGTSLEPPAKEGETARFPLVVALTGTFPSRWKGQPSPYDQGGGGEGDPSGRTIERSLPDARLVVLASADMVSDLMMSLANDPMVGEVHRGNLQLLQNLVDWSVEDTDLLEIRTAGSFARTLAPMDEEARSTLELAQYALAGLLLLAIAWLPRSRRRAQAPLPLPSPVETA